MENVDRDLEYIKKHIKNGGKAAYCCILFDKNGVSKERFYFLSHTMDVTTVFGEIELWKLDIKEHMEYPSEWISAYIKLEGEKNEIF